MEIKLYLLLPMLIREMLEKLQFLYQEEGGGITKSLNISQNGVPKINMVEIGGYVFEIDRARRY